MRFFISLCMLPYTIPYVFIMRWRFSGLLKDLQVFDAAQAVRKYHGSSQNIQEALAPIEAKIGITDAAKIRTVLRRNGLTVEKAIELIELNLDSNMFSVGVIEIGRRSSSDPLWMPARFLFAMGALTSVLDAETRERLLEKVNQLCEHSWGAVRGPAYQTKRQLELCAS